MAHCGYTVMHVKKRAVVILTFPNLSRPFDCSGNTDDCRLTAMFHFLGLESADFGQRTRDGVSSAPVPVEGQGLSKPTESCHLQKAETKESEVHIPDTLLTPAVP